MGPAAPRRDPRAPPAPETELAEAAYREALALADELGMRPLQAHCHHGLGTLYAKIGQRGAGPRRLSAAIELYRAMEMTFWLPQAEAAAWRRGGREARVDEDVGVPAVRSTRPSRCCERADGWPIALKRQFHLDDERPGGPQERASFAA